MNTHEVLVAARNLAERKWGQSGPCISNCILQSGETFGPAHETLYEVLGLTGPSVSSSIFAWNDTPGRTKEEVLAALDKAIAATAPEPYVHLEVPEEVTV